MMPWQNTAFRYSVGMELPGHYENLARQLKRRYPHLRLVNSYSVKESRKQSMLRTEKTDEYALWQPLALLVGGANQPATVAWQSRESPGHAILRMRTSIPFCFFKSSTSSEGSVLP